MNPTDGKPEPTDAEKAARLLEIELMQQRTARQQAGPPYRGLRAVSILFLVVVILGVLFALYYAFSSGRIEEMRSKASHQATPSAEEMASPQP